MARIVPDKSAKMLFYIYLIEIMVKSHKQRGGWAGEEGSKVRVDLLEFYDRYMRKAEGSRAGKTPVLVEGVKNISGTNNSLIIVDMQPGFVNAFPTTTRAFGGPGAFAVADGENVVDPMIKFMNINMAFFTKVILTRDTHDADHCSFKTFPPHCIINSKGAALIPELEAFKGQPKVEVIFKGMNPKVDSFGGLKYHADDYYATRQMPGCCNNPSGDADGVSCSDATGGFYLKDRSQEFEIEPFTNKLATTYAEIKEDFGKRFEIDDLLNGQTSGEHNVFVCGLAGDFCVKDTAFNIAKHGTYKGVKLNVFVLQPLTRYPLLPVLYDKGDKAPFLALDAADPKNTKKDFNKYIFQYVAGGKKILSVKDVQDMAASIATGSPNPLESDPTYGHFLTNPIDLLNDYGSLDNIKVLMELPTFATSGGYRRNRKTRHKKNYRRNRKTRRN
jgi:hypothetical protein